MTIQEFTDILQNDSYKDLLFEYRPGHFVNANYHITEVKHLQIDSVDCGGKTDSWTETIIQLWESPKEKYNTNHMSAFKALGILQKVGRLRALDKQSEVKIEYSNDNFHTAQLTIQKVQSLENKLIVKLNSQATNCKASDICGVPAEMESISDSSKECCTDETGCC